MRDKEELLRDFDVDHDLLVRTPGPYWGEALWVPYFHERYLLGDGVELPATPTAYRRYRLAVRSEDVEMFASLVGYPSIILEFRANGKILGLLSSNKE